MTTVPLIGLPSTTFVVEDIIERMDVLTTANGSYLRHVGKAPGSLDKMAEPAFQDVLYSMGGQAPAVFVALDDYRGFEGTSNGTRWITEAEVLVYCANNHRTSLTDGRLDPIDRAGVTPEEDPGARTIVEDVFSLLAGWTPPSVPSAGRMQPLRGTPRVIERAWYVFEWRFQIKMRLGGNVVLDPPPAIVSVNVKNNVRDEQGNTALVVEEELS